jgi:hypothetical protein
VESSFHTAPTLHAAQAEQSDQGDSASAIHSGSGASATASVAVLAPTSVSAAPPDSSSEISDTELLAACERIENKRARLVEPSMLSETADEAVTSFAESSVATTSHVASTVAAPPFAVKESQISEATPLPTTSTTVSLLDDITDIMNNWVGEHQAAAPPPPPSQQLPVSAPTSPTALCRPNQNACLAWALVALMGHLQDARAEMDAGTEAQRVWSKFMKEVAEWDAKLA